MSATKELQVKEKTQVEANSENTKPGLRYTPDVDIFETENEIILLADIPGVNTNDLNIDLRDNVLTLEGEVASFESTDEHNVAIEFGVGKYWRQFTLSEVIDQPQIQAELNNGALRLKLPKVEKAQPRRIEVKAA